MKIAVSESLPLLSDAVRALDAPGLSTLFTAFREKPRADALLVICDQLFPRLEASMWQHERLDREALASYQAIVREVDAWLCARPHDPRHLFQVVIPVADRPRHLRSCLESLETLCRLFPWGRVAVLVADDSGQPENIQAHQEIIAEFRARGLDARYYGQEQQLARLEELNAGSREALKGVLGDQDATRFWHKGASHMRNISYLELMHPNSGKGEPLFWFVDSDQEFRAGKDYALNYFFHLDRLFTRQAVTLFTGKVVGDPPVSPAVMASNFLDDVLAFMNALSERDAGEACHFHDQTERRADDAAYHDMAELFGFQGKHQPFAYRCPLQGYHDHRRCLEEYAARLNGFFDGEHLTRQTAYAFKPLEETLAPARTVYTGNYVFNRAGLEYFIPFAALRLRMAGPVLGRIVAAEQGAGFVSSNLPMLHKRTVTEAGRAEFRPGIEHQEDYSDISGEFERQYYGDVMLFSMIRLTELGYPATPPAPEAIGRILEEVEAEMAERYARKRQDILAKTAALRELLDDGGQWWRDCPEVLQPMHRFLGSMEHSFGDEAAGVRQMNSPGHREARLADMARALAGYPRERALWRQLLA